MANWKSLKLIKFIIQLHLPPSLTAIGTMVLIFVNNFSNDEE